MRDVLLAPFGDKANRRTAAERIGVVGDLPAGGGVENRQHAVERLAEAIVEAANGQSCAVGREAVLVDLGESRQAARRDGGQRRQVDDSLGLGRFDDFNRVADVEDHRR